MSVGNRATHIGWIFLVSAAVAALLLVLARGVINHVVVYDELLHILAARGMVETGLPVIAGGIYERGELYTHLVAFALVHFGDTPVAARLPALAGGVLLVFLLSLWVGRKAGLLAGASAGLFLCVVPGTVDVAVFARFYTLHALVMLMMFIAAFEASLPHKPKSARFGWSIFALALLPLGWHLQETTLIAAVAALVGVLVILIMSHWAIARAVFRSYPIAILLSVCGLAAVGLVVLAEFGFWDKFVKAPLWAAGRAGRYHYYLEEFSRELPLLWPLLPAAIFFGMVDPRTRRVVGYCVTVLVVSLMIHSLAGAKAVRYVYYVVPMACAAWGVAVANIVTRGIERGDRVGSTGYDLPRWTLPCMILLGLILSQEGIRTMRLIAGRLQPTVALSYGAEADWGPAVASLDQVLRSADIVVTSNAMKALFFLGRYDYELNASIVQETDTDLEFGVDARTGERAIGTAKSVERVLDMPGSALVVLEEEKIGKASGIPADAVTVIQSRCRLVDTAATPGIRAWLCPRRFARP